MIVKIRLFGILSDTYQVYYVTTNVNKDYLA